MSVYLDASVLVAFFTDDSFSARAEAFLRGETPDIVVSDFAAAEFASTVARDVRVGDIDPDRARDAFAALDAWTARTVLRVETGPGDISVATEFLRRLDLNLRTPDAINIAIALRLGATLATFDKKMATNARALGADLAAV